YDPLLNPRGIMNPGAFQQWGWDHRYELMAEYAQAMMMTMAMAAAAGELGSINCFLAGTPVLVTEDADFLSSEMSQTAGLGRTDWERLALPLVLGYLTLQAFQCLPRRKDISMNRFRSRKCSIYPRDTRDGPGD